jgi:hypothetical protein
MELFEQNLLRNIDSTPEYGPQKYTKLPDLRGIVALIGWLQLQ